MIDMMASTRMHYIPLLRLLWGTDDSRQYNTRSEYRYSGGLNRRSVSDAMIDVMGQTQRGDKDSKVHHKSSESDGGEYDKGSLQI